MYVSQVKEHLASGSFEDLITILKKFLGFMNLTVRQFFFFSRAPFKAVLRIDFYVDNAVLS